MSAIPWLLGIKWPLIVWYTIKINQYLRNISKYIKIYKDIKELPSQNITKRGAQSGEEHHDTWN